MAAPFFPQQRVGFPGFQQRPTAWPGFPMAQPGFMPYGGAKAAPWGGAIGGPQPMQPAVPQRGAAQAMGGFGRALGQALRTPVGAPAQPATFALGQAPMLGGFGARTVQTDPRFAQMMAAAHGPSQMMTPPQAYGIGGQALGSSYSPGPGYSPFGGQLPQMDPALMARAMGGYGQRIPFARTGGGLF